MSLFGSSVGFLVALAIGSSCCLPVSAASPNSSQSFALKQASQAEKAPLLAYSTSTLYPFLWGRKSDAALFSENLLNQPESARDPLQIAFAAFQLLVEGAQNADEAKLITARRYLNYLANDYTPVLKSESGWSWLYAFPYPPLPAGWWSAMSNALIGLAFQAGAQWFNDPQYALMAKRAINGMLRSPADGGSLVSLSGGGCWLSEYTWKEMKPEQEMYVLNGHLFALQALWMVAEATQDPTWMASAKCGIRGLKELNETFHTEDKSWFWYAKSPRIITQPHYVIFETTQFAAMQQLTGDIFFAEETAWRRKVLAQQYPIYSAPHSTYQGEGTLDFLFSRIGPPHFYTIDLYAQRIVCFDAREAVTRLFYSKPNEEPSFFTRAYVHGSLPSATTHCQVYAVSGNDLFLLYDSPLTPLSLPLHQLNGPSEKGYELSTIFDAIKDGPDSVTIDPDLSPRPEARLMFKLSQPLKRSQARYLARFGNFESTLPMGMGVVDAKDVEAFRYLTPPKPEKDALILMHWRGFEQIDATGDEITLLRLYLYTPRADATRQRKFRISKLRLFEFESLAEIYSYWVRNISSVNIPEQLRRAPWPALTRRPGARF